MIREGNRWYPRGWPWAGVTLGLALALGGLGFPPATVAKPLTYGGEFLFSGHGTVELTVRHAKHGRPQGTLTINELPFACEDGSLIFFSSPPLKLNFTARRQFLGDAYTPASPGSPEMYVGTHGRIASNYERSAGNVFAYVNPDDASDENALECSSQIDAVWEAKRRR